MTLDTAGSGPFFERVMNSPGSGCIEDCVVWLGPELEPTHCRSFRREDGRIIGIQESVPATRADGARRGIFPGLVNAHTHIADGFSERTMNDLTDAAWREVETITRHHFQQCRELTGTLVTRTSPCDIVKTVLHGNVLHEF